VPPTIEGIAMPLHPARVAFALLVTVWRTTPAAAQVTAPLDRADSLFAAGAFVAAESAFRARWDRDTTDQPAARRLGTLALWSNRLDDAERWLGRAIALRPDDAAALAQLGEARYRRDDFRGAATPLRAAGRAVRAEKLEHFSGASPNRIGGTGEVTRLPFVVTDPLPIVRANVNGSDTLYLLIDTGGGELVLDSVVAAQLGVPVLGRSTGMFAGGAAPVGHGSVDSVRLGGFTVYDVPITIINARQFERAVGHRVDGVLGTVLLYHFLATIDYRHGELVLRRRSPGSLSRFEAEASATTAAMVPFWLAGDHFMFAPGRVNGRPPVLLFVDTGLAGGGFVASDSAARTLGIDLSQVTRSEGVGGAGPVQVTWFTVDSIALGGITARGIRGALGQLAFRQSFGFDAAGIVSHAVFRPYALTFDFDGMRLFLQR
jgi:predicted aspartyl protease